MCFYNKPHQALCQDIFYCILYTFKYYLYFLPDQCYIIAMKAIFKIDLSQHATMPQLISIKLREDILNGELSCGTSLKQDQLAKKYSTSVGVVREALKALEGEGFVEFVPNKGVFVKALSSQEALELFDVRYLLEAEALSRSLPLLTEADFFLLDGILDEEEFCSDPLRYNELNSKLHSFLYQHCGNSKLLETITRLNNQVSRYMIFYLNNMLHKEDSQKEHRQLLEACKNQDKKAAKAILKKHMQKAGKELADYLNKHPQV